MRAAIGDTLHIHTNHVGEAEALGEILEVRGTDGAPPYLVQFRDGRTRLLYPGPDAVVEAPPPAGPPAVGGSVNGGTNGSVNGGKGGTDTAGNNAVGTSTGSSAGTGAGSAGNSPSGGSGNANGSANNNAGSSRPPRSARRIHTRPGW
jgi:hypothetical protein